MSSSEGARRVCVVLLTGLGDVVLGLPFVNALARDDPSRRITWVVDPMPAGILRHHPAISDVVVYHKRRGLRGIVDLWRDLAGHHFDLTINLSVYLHGFPPTVLSRAPIRFGFARPRSRDLVWLALNRAVTPRRGQHLADDVLQFLDPLGIEPLDPPEWRIEFTQTDRETQRAFFAQLSGRPVATIVPTSGQRPKDWFADRWSSVAEALDRDFGFRVVLVGGPGAHETAVARAIVDAASPAPVWALGDSVRQLARILDGSRLVLAPDTGPLHLARALDVPVIGLYGRTSPWRVGPYRAFEDLWIDAYTDSGAAPEPGARTPKVGRMERIAVTDVLERVERALARYPRARGELRGGAA